MKIEVNGVESRVPEGITVFELILELGLKPELIAVELNREVVPRARREEVRVAEGDAVELVTLVGGG